MNFLYLTGQITTCPKIYIKTNHQWIYHFIMKIINPINSDRYYYLEIITNHEKYTQGDYIIIEGNLELQKITINNSNLAIRMINISFIKTK